jgi:NCS1 family nucleobase:cation symporter-1
MTTTQHGGAPAANLWNEDLAPTTLAQRTWRWYHFAALWVGMVMCIPAYMLAASLIEGGMSWGQAVLTCSSATPSCWCRCCSSGTRAPSTAFPMR